MRLNEEKPKPRRERIRVWKRGDEVSLSWEPSAKGKIHVLGDEVSEIKWPKGDPWPSMIPNGQLRPVVHRERVKLK